MSPTKRIQKLIYLISVIIFVLVVGPWVYINIISEDAPTPFSELQNGQETFNPNNSVVDIAGLWTVSSGSKVGYRVKEQIVLRKLETVGRTESVSGSLSILKLEVKNASFEVDMKTLQSDRGQRDAQFNGRIMDTDTYPKAFFELNSSIFLLQTPEPGQTILKSAVGNLTLRGITKEVVFFVSASLNNAIITITGQIPIRFSEWGIPNPSVPVVFIFTEANGLLEFNLVFKKVEG